MLEFNSSQRGGIPDIAFGFNHGKMAADLTDEIMRQLFGNDYQKYLD
jgi:hypothetical protein